MVWEKPGQKSSQDPISTSSQMQWFMLVIQSYAGDWSNEDHGSGPAEISSQWKKAGYGGEHLSSQT
jgi:hypothetical protein